MNVLIIEDEPHAANRLKRLLKKQLPEAFIHGTPESIHEAIIWFKNNPRPDLVLLDIHLADGHSFEIFDRIELDVPIIFTTAYDQYAIRAFKVNSIDYLLKPISPEDLKTSLDKFRSHATREIIPSIRYQDIKDTLKSPYKTRFITRIGNQLQTVETFNILYTYIWEKGTYLHTVKNKNVAIDYSLEQMESLLNPETFFRLNRQFITRYEAIDKIISYSNSRLCVKLMHLDEKIILSRERTRLFKEWIDR